MSSADRCDLILRLIDETLATAAIAAPRGSAITGAGPAWSARAADAPRHAR